MVVVSSRRNGVLIDAEMLALLDDLDAAASEYQALQLVPCPSGQAGRPQIDVSRKMVSTKTAAQRLGVSERQVRRRIAQRDLAAERSSSGGWLVDEDSITEFIASQKQAS